MKKSDKKYTSKIISTKENIPILPTESSIQAVKSLLKGSRFSSKKYFHFKKEDKHLEDNCLDTRFAYMKDRNMLRKELKNLFKSMDFICDNFLNKEGTDEKQLQIFFNIYQQLAIAWEHLGLQCKHWDGFRKTKEKSEICRICGKIKGIDDQYYLLPKSGQKKIGKKLFPNSKKVFENRATATIVNDTIDFYGASLNVDVHNRYKSKLFKDIITLADERIVTLKESGIECCIDQHLIHIRMNKPAKKVGKKKYGAFLWELIKKDLKKFPVIVDYDENRNFLGLTILK